MRGGTTIRCFALGLIVSVSVVRAQEQPADEELDIRLFRAINSTQDPAREKIFDWVDATAISSFAVIPTVYTVARTLDGVEGGIDNAGILLIVSQALSFGVTGGLKHLVGRPRPFDALENVNLRPRKPPSDPSFPSGHTSQAFAIATFLSLKHPNALVIIPAFLWATTIGYARVYLGYHYPSDVVGGMLVGAGVAWAVWQNRTAIVRWKQRTFGGENVSIADQKDFGGRVEILRLSIPIAQF